MAEPENKGFPLAIVIGSIVALSIVIVMIVILMKKKKAKQHKDDMDLLDEDDIS